MIVLAAVQNSENLRSALMLSSGLHRASRSMISASPGMSTTRAPVMPRFAACSRTVVVGLRPLLDSWSQLSFCSPGMWVVSHTSTSAATHSSVHIIAALVTMLPLGRSVRAHVRAVMLSPRRAKVRPLFPRMTCPTTAMIAPRNSHRFWKETYCADTRSYLCAIYCLVLDELNSAVTDGGNGEKESRVRVKAVLY
jgi:hypothetical protein